VVFEEGLAGDGESGHDMEARGGFCNCGLPASWTSPFMLLPKVRHDNSLHWADVRLSGWAEPAAERILVEAEERDRWGIWRDLDLSN
jgi:transposase